MDMILLDQDAKVGLVELYRPLIVEQLNPFPLLEQFHGILSDEAVSHIQHQSGKSNAASGRFLDHLYASRDPSWLTQLIDALERQGLQSVVKGMTHPLRDEANYRKILSRCALLLETLKDPLLLLPPLTQYKVLSPTESDLIRICNTRKGYKEAVRMLLQLLPRSNPYWYPILMEFLRSSAEPSLMAMRTALDGNNQTSFVNNADDDEEMENVTTNINNLQMDRPVSSSLGHSSVGSNSRPQPKPAVATFSHSQSSEQTPRNAHKTLEMRSYQLELAQSALEGFNTIICAPTGSGKTVVAIQIIERHLSSGSRSNMKVAFFVPTTSLVEQQAESVRSYLGDGWTVKTLMGGPLSAKDPPRHTVIRKTNVIVMTPAILLNLLHDVDDECRVSITEFSLLIFDECHHTDKDHPYKSIMNDFYDVKEAQPNARMPQIVGLTASVGVGNADSKPMAIQHIMGVCANMNAQKLITVEDKGNLEELQSHVFAPKDELIKVKPSHISSHLSLQIVAMMKQIEARAKPLIKSAFEILLPAQSGAFRPLADIPDVSPTGKLIVKPDPPFQRWTPEYNQWVTSLLRKFPVLNDSDVKSELLSLLQHLEIYHDTLVISTLLPSKQAVAFLTAKMKEKRKRISTSSWDHWLVNSIYGGNATLLQSYGNTNIWPDIVQTLKDFLVKEYQAHPETRAIVFVQTRALTEALENFMSEDPQLANLGAFRCVSSNVSAGQGGQTQAQQQELLEQFRNGERKVMIATTVAEEGLDIQKCSLIVKYNFVTNEIAMVQKRGRGRAVGSKSVLLTYENKIGDKEMLNMERERLMKQAISDIRARGHQWFVEEIQKCQRLEYQKRMVNAREADQIRQKLGNKTFQLLCVKCDQPICLSIDIRVIYSQYAIVDGDIWSKVKTDPHPKPKSYSSMAIPGMFGCPNPKCRESWGQVGKHREIFFPLIKADAFVFVPIEGGPKQHVRKWKTIATEHFYIPTVEESDFCRMYKAAQQPTYLNNFIPREEDEDE